MARKRRARRANEGPLLELIGDVCGLLDLDELRHGLLESVQRMIPSDYISLNDVGPTPEQIVAIIRPDQPAKQFEIWARLAHENPLLRRVQRTRDGRAYRFSDVIEPDALHALALYKELYAPMGVEHQLAFTLPASRERVLAIALSRGAENDFSDEERDLANRARPFLIQAYLNAIAHQQARSRQAGDLGELLLAALLRAGLTRRESQALRLVALGRSNRDVAVALGISERTVGKHLEHGFRKLGVNDRSAAAARAWELAGVADGVSHAASR